MYANSEDFQVLAITTMVSSFVAEWNDQNMKLHHGEDLNSAKYSARPRLAVCCHQQRQYQTGLRRFLLVNPLHTDNAVVPADKG